MPLKNLTIKSMPEALYRLLKERAAQHRRSINSEVIVCLEQSLQSDRVDPMIQLRKLDALREGHPLPPLTDAQLRRVKSAGRP